ncbi:metallophosphoesterase [Agrobacterium sp. CG674]
MIYGVVSDIHANAWSVFSTINPDGVNSRLRIILNELLRAANTVKKMGGKTLIIGGDILHTRGSIDPEVINPVRDTFKQILASGISCYAIPGNHDMKSKTSTKLSSSIQNLEEISLEGTEFRIFNDPTVVEIDGDVFGFVPWRYTMAELLSDLKNMSAHPSAAKMDVFIHAGIDGVLSGVSAHGLTHEMLAEFGFRNVMAGDYHNFKRMGNIWSIGATTHQNWGDVNTKAGFLTVNDGDVTWHDTMAPKFIDVSVMDELEMEAECLNNYVRFRGPAMLQSQITELRNQFRAWGALGTSIEVPKATAATRPSAGPTKALSLNDSVETYVRGLKTLPDHVDVDRVAKRSAEVLSATQLVYEEA